jgi:outer membrane protein OmpA-like peptidoglycan-associated protein
VADLEAENTKYLQQQGINTTMLSATAFGEFKPPANNSTPEGRAKTAGLLSFY